jgi:hypothetical protein
VIGLSCKIRVARHDRVALVIMAQEMARSLKLVACLAIVLSGCDGSTSETNERDHETNESRPTMNQDSSNIVPALFIQQAIEGLRTQTAAHASTWHLGEEENWSADQESGRIGFSFSDGIIAEADMQIIGTYNTEGV